MTSCPDFFHRLQLSAGEPTTSARAAELQSHWTTPEISILISSKFYLSSNLSSETRIRLCILRLSFCRAKCIYFLFQHSNYWICVYKLRFGCLMYERLNSSIHTESSDTSWRLKGFFGNVHSQNPKLHVSVILYMLHPTYTYSHASLIHHIIHLIIWSNQSVKKFINWHYLYIFELKLIQMVYTPWIWVHDVTVMFRVRKYIYINSLLTVALRVRTRGHFRM